MNGYAPEGRYEALFNNMSEGFVLCEAVRDEAGRLVDYIVRDANPAFRRRAPGGAAMIGRRQTEIRPGVSAAWFAACARALAGEAVRFEFRDRLSGRWYDVHMSRISDVEFGQFFVDVSERKAAERRQAELFEELNHRVKNNLAVVSSILELQARASSDEVRAHLSKAVDRIRSIADLHAALYQQKSSEDVALCPYLEDLGRRLAASLFEDDQARISVRCEAIRLPVKEAVSLGLIVNELVTNAAKHALAGRAEGHVEVTASRAGGDIRLVVSDDGPGIAPEQTELGAGLGLRAVRSLAEGLGGRVRVLDGPGGRIEVSAPAKATAANDARQQALL
ncbi:MAG TPA: sensor histidine kinase [Phenylobacterium sp.]|uniref:sensor histidine kinase n=1 Tax=Phenylobacterium sp. TaxID=1871053 RepID=UPI002BF913BD|nr:sensor histidine kinase [Phenylobacterium sp.]HSV02035.1 sensor histidine kinase [Phenylobacterium sp.]